MLKELLYILAAPMASLAGLAAFETWWSAAIFVSGIGLAVVFAVRHHNKHHRPEAYDDKLSTERMEAARKRLMEDR